MEPRRSIPGHNYWCEVNWFWTPANVVLELEDDARRIQLICTCQPIDQPEWTAKDQLTWQVKCPRCGALKGHYCVYTDMSRVPAHLSDHTRSATARKRLARLGRATLRPHNERRWASDKFVARREAARRSQPRVKSADELYRESERAAISQANQEAMLREYRALHDWLVRHGSILIVGPSTVVDARESNREERNEE